MRIRFLLFSIFAVLVTGPVTANPIRLTFALEAAQTLPGIPVTAYPGSRGENDLAPFVQRCWSAARIDRGHPECSILRASGDHDREPTSIQHHESRELAAGEERTFDFYAAPGSPPWFYDERLQRPGTYRLRFRADREVSNGNWLPPSDPIISNEVLTITAPFGVDAEARAPPVAAAASAGSCTPQRCGASIRIPSIRR